MLSLMYNLVKYALDYTPFAKAETNNDADELITRIKNAQEEEKLTEVNGFINNESYRVGIVSHIFTDYVLIDNHYICDIVNVLIKDIKTGDKVQYLLSLPHNKNNPTVRTIISINDTCWDDIEEKPETNIPPLQTLTKSVIGKVVERKSRIILIEPHNVSVDLNKVQSDFIPVIGDWLKLDSIVEVNTDSVDLSGKVLEINRINSLRSKVDFGIVTTYDTVKEAGVIDNSIVFSKAICDLGYIPCVGDKVFTDSIESDQGIYAWRALSVVPVVQVAKEQIQLPSPLSSDITKEDLDELLRNKCGIVISNDLHINLNIEEEKNVSVTIQNTSNITQMLLRSYFYSKKAQSQLTLKEPSNLHTSFRLNPSDSVSFIFKCNAKFIGATEELFVFNFQDFEIGRIFHVTVNSKAVSNRNFRNNHTKSKRNNFKRDLDDLTLSNYIPGVRPYNPATFIKVRNTVFKIPRYYWELVLNHIDLETSPMEWAQEIENAIHCLSKELTFESYKDRFHALLHFEEIAHRINIQQYNMDSIILKRSGEYLVMKVPGLAEKRPSLLVGDSALISFKWDQSQGKQKYEGYIHKVTNCEIFLKFNRKFHQDYNNENCQVSFKCSNSTIQRCHNAVNLAITHLGRNFLFPTHVVHRESQLTLEETEIEETPANEKHKHNRNSSLSSESSCTSATSNGNKSTNSRSSTRLSVVERLFNIKPEANNSVVKTESNNSKKNDSINAAPMQNNKLSRPPRNDVETQPCISKVKRRKLVWFNKHLNYYQKEAIRNILHGYARPLPYIIFGPPGTGKTITACETILQILSVIPESRLLVATPSNSSANLIAERLLDSGVLKPGDMVRLLARHCLEGDMIPEKLLPYCATAEISAEGTVERTKYNAVGPRINCTMSVLGRHRITIGTCIALGILYNMGFPRGHFTHVIVDEAGQATEPEIMIPLNFIHFDSGQVILVGDPLQLGPVVQSKVAKNFGLDESFLVRLLRYFPYQRDPEGFKSHYDPRLVTKLVMNYRSLPEILELPSSLFYNSELQPQVSPENSREMKILQSLATELPEREGIPPAVIFHGVNGENCKDVDSPSWYNPEEATQVYLYLLKLYKCGLSPNDIGIITPYQKQVLQIRDLLLELDIEQPKISSVEGFQGQERNVIIISAVRSCNNALQEDIKHSLGFVACPRRLNVAITRARALLIILGNPKLLAMDPYWRSVLMYCADRAAYTGCNSISLKLDTQPENY